MIFWGWVFPSFLAFSLGCVPLLYPQYAFGLFCHVFFINTCCFLPIKKEKEKEKGLLFSFAISIFKCSECFDKLVSFLLYWFRVSMPKSVSISNIKQYYMELIAIYKRFLILFIFLGKRS